MILLLWSVWILPSVRSQKRRTVIVEGKPARAMSKRSPRRRAKASLSRSSMKRAKAGP